MSEDDFKENSFDCLPNSSRTLASFHVTQLRVRLFVCCCCFSFSLLCVFWQTQVMTLPVARGPRQLILGGDIRYFLATEMCFSRIKFLPQYRLCQSSCEDLTARDQESFRVKHESESLLLKLDFCLDGFLAERSFERWCIVVKLKIAFSFQHTRHRILLLLWWGGIKEQQEPN